MRALLLLPLLVPALPAADWPQLRGPGASGLCPSCSNLPTEFGPNKNVLWKTPVPAGNSSPVLIGDRIFLTANEGDDLITLCLNRSNGELLWRKAIPAPRREAQNSLNHRAAPTAVSDGKSVFVFFADFGLLAYDLAGHERWRLPLGPFNSLHGVAASPVYADGRVLLVCDQDTDAFILAVDAATGKVVWKVAREVSNGYSTPTIYRPPSGPAQVIAPGSYQLISYSVADGKPLWFVRGLTCQPKSAPTIAGDVLYFNGWTVGNDAGQQVQLPTFAEAIASADANHDAQLSQQELPREWQPTGTWRAIDLDRNGFLNEREWTLYRSRRASRNASMAVRLGGSGDVTDTHVLWRYEKSLPDVPAPLVYNNVVYLVKSGGIATTLDAPSGKVLKVARLSGALEDYYASPVGADGKVYLASEHGKVVVLKATGDWEILAVNDFDSGIYATPAIADGKIYLRTRDALYAIASPR
jgi:outer membrane protein assembly factor BamB